MNNINGMIEATHSENQVKNYYAWRASNYDAGSGFEIEPHKKAVELSNVKEGDNVLVLACGSGRGLDQLAQKVGSSGHIDALDISPNMILKAKQKIEKMGLSDRVTFIEGNALNLPYESNKYDIVYNGYMFDLIKLDNFKPILLEMRRVLKTGGKLVLLNMSKRDEKKTFFEKIYEKKLAFMPCRPVLMRPYVELTGFNNIERYYMESKGIIISRLWGQEIVTAQK